ncbi:hypothetical protein Hesp01_38990 [Herbidospora sp. NBRC 101105]|nr:hypothetical protein Hesp01_38990 [Herbidospora sp. NBRC 101105]
MTPIRQAVAHFLRPETSGEYVLGKYLPTIALAMLLWDDDQAAIMRRGADVARHAGSLFHLDAISTRGRSTPPCWATSTTATRWSASATRSGPPWAPPSSSRR